MSMESAKLRKSARAQSAPKNSNSARDGSNRSRRSTRSPGQSATNRGGFKRFMMKMVGALDKTEFPQDITVRLVEVDEYQVALEKLATNICLTAQQTPGLVSIPSGEMNFVYPNGQNPFEKLKKAMDCDIAKSAFENQALLQDRIVLLDIVANTHREYQQRVRHDLSKIRRFLLTDFQDLETERRKLNAARQELDFSRHELKNAKGPDVPKIRKDVFEQAQTAYNIQLTKVNGMLGQLPTNKDQHCEEIQRFVHHYKKFHDFCLVELKKIKTS